MDFNVCICEDTPLDVILLKTIVDKWAQKNNKNVVYTVYTNVFDFEFPEVDNYQIIFMDVQLGEEKGYDLARKIRLLDIFVPIVYTTLYSQYSAQCNGTVFLRYLLKPLKEQECFKVLDDAVRFARGRAPQYAILNKIEFCVNEILYFEVNDHTALLHKVGKADSIPIAMSLTDIVALLPAHMFFRPHRSYIINLLYIKKLEKNSAFLSDDVQIPISRDCAKELKKLYFGILRGES